MEQYLSYSRDLAHQAERLGEQIAKYQQENARLVTREARLVQHVTSLETQLQGVVSGYWLLRFSRAENVVNMQETLGWRTNGCRWMGQWDSGTVGHGQAGGGLPE